MPGSIFYFRTTQMKLNTMLRQGHHLPILVPTWFATFSPADTYWPELFKVILPHLSVEQIKLLTPGVRSQILADHPQFAAQVFWFRWQSFWKHILNGKSKPLGHIIDFFVRVEFQMRGSPHIHMLLWIIEAANALKLQEADEGLAELSQMLDKFIRTWTLPITSV